MLYNDDNGNDNNNNSSSIHDNNIGNLALSNPRGGFYCPRFQEETTFGMLYFRGVRIVGEP